jgi:predicted NBD/HSP70 family sugar kinase
MPPLQRSAARVLETLSGEPDGLTRTEIANATALSPPTVAAVLAELTERGMAVEGERSLPPGGTGRPAARWTLTLPAGVVVGLDLGHSHLRALIADAAGNPVGLPVSKPCDVDREGPPVLLDAADVIRQALVEVGSDLGAVLAIGVGLPAPIAHDGTVASPDFLPTWGDIDVADELLALLAPHGLPPHVPVKVENDANLGALGESLHGAARQASDYLYVKVSTGIGMGVVLEDTLYRGAHGLAAEFGHIAVPAEAERAVAERSSLQLPRSECPRCKRLDCLQNLASCRAIVDQLIETTRDRPRGEERYPDDLTIEHVIAQAKKDAVMHPLCHQAVVNAGMRIGAALGELVRILDPELVVIGGVLAGADEVLLGQIRSAVDRGTLPPARIQVERVKQDRIERSEVEGAVALALELLKPSDVLTQSVAD